MAPRGEGRGAGHSWRHCGQMLLGVGGAVRRNHEKSRIHTAWRGTNFGAGPCDKKCRSGWDVGRGTWSKTSDVSYRHPIPSAANAEQVGPHPLLAAVVATRYRPIAVEPVHAIPCRRRDVRHHRHHCLRLH